MIIFRFITQFMAPLTLAGAIVAYFIPALFLVFGSIFLWLFATTMFALGLVLETDELKQTLRHPGQIGLGVLTQYTVMPLLGFAAGTIAVANGAAPEIGLGFVIVGCAPGAMASNVIVYLAGGAMAFSIALTTVATMLSPVLTPTLVQALGGSFLPVEFWPLMKTILLVVLLPLSLGYTLRRFLGKAMQTVKQIAPAVAALSIIIICSFAVAKNQAMIGAVGIQVIVLVVIVNALGYLLGYLLARLYHFDQVHRLTLSLEIGMQNAGLGVALALQHFAPITALPGALFAVWCIVTAAGASAWLRRSQAAKLAEQPQAV